MGACPVTQGGVSLGVCGSLGELRLPAKRGGCADCFASELLEAPEQSSDHVETKASSGKVLVPPSSRCSSQEPETYYQLALIHNVDFAKDVGQLPAEAARARVERIVKEWREKLQAGMRISLGAEIVTFSYDSALQCLDAREHGSLYPLAALHECSHLPRAYEGASFELRAEFNESEVLIFHFVQGYDRAAFALTLQALASEARKDKWHEDWCAEGWDEEVEEADESTAEPEDDPGSPKEASTNVRM